MLIIPGFALADLALAGQLRWPHVAVAVLFFAYATIDLTLAISEEAKKIAWKAQQRLHKRYKALAARDKNKNQIVTAIGRELLGFVWAIGMETEKQLKQSKAA